MEYGVDLVLSDSGKHNNGVSHQSCVAAMTPSAGARTPSPSTSLTRPPFDQFEIVNLDRRPVMGPCCGWKFGGFRIRSEVYS